MLGTPTVSRTGRARVLSSEGWAGRAQVLGWALGLQASNIFVGRAGRALEWTGPLMAGLGLHGVS